MDNIVGPMILKQRKLRGHFLNLASAFIQVSRDAHYQGRYGFDITLSL